MRNLVKSVQSNYPGNFPGNVICLWELEAKSGHGYEVTFDGNTLIADFNVVVCADLGLNQCLKALSTAIISYKS